MGSKVVVTYQRKRLFSRSDHSLVNLNSDTSSECAKSKTSDSFRKQEGTIAECTLQNNDSGFGICHAYSKDNIREDVLQTENRCSFWCSRCSEKHAVKPKMLYSACSEQKKSSVSDETEKFTMEQKCSPRNEVKQMLSHPTVFLEGSPNVRYKIDSACQSNAEDNIAHTHSKLSFVKLGSEYEDNSKKILTVPQAPDACSDAEPDPQSLKISAGIDHSCQMKGMCTSDASVLEGTEKLNTDQYNSLHNNSGIKRKLTSVLITFCRRSKRNRAEIASKSETLPAARSLVDLNEEFTLPNSVAGNEEKDVPEDIDNSSSFSAPAPATPMVVLADNPQHFLHGEAEEAPNAASQFSQDSQEQMTFQKLSNGVQDSDNINVTTQRLSDEDVKRRKMQSDVAGRESYSPNLDLSVPPLDSHNFDCNVPPDAGSDENLPVEKLEVVHDSLGSTSKKKDDLITFPVQHMENGSPMRAACDEGKCILNSSPALTGSSSTNNYIQFFPESKMFSKLNLANSSEKVSPLVPSNSIGLSLQLELMVDGPACFPPTYEWPNLQVQTRESLLSLQLSTSDRAHPFSRDSMMLDNILTRARAVRGNRSSFLDKFEYPTTWLEEELDSLWIGVRRHGRGNWDAILGDRRLHFLPWKSPYDLAERWQVEQSRLLSSMPVSQRRYMSPPDFSSEHVSSLHHSRPEGHMDDVQLSLGQSHPVQKGLPLHFKNNNMSKDHQKPVTNLGNGCFGLVTLSEGSAIIGDESSSTAGLINGSLQHWLRTTAEIPPGPSRLIQAIPSARHSGIAWLDHPTLNCPGTSHQPWLNNRCISTKRRAEPQKDGMAPCSDSPLVIERGKAQPEDCMPNKEDSIVILSDASSEETISDDHSRLS